MLRRRIWTETKSQYVAVDPQDESAQRAGLVPQGVAEGHFGAAPVAVKEWGFEDVHVVSPRGVRLRGSPFHAPQSPPHRHAVPAAADDERAIDRAVRPWERGPRQCPQTSALAEIVQLEHPAVHRE